MSRPHVLIVGAGGVFGGRLARLLARKQAYRLSFGGRDEGRVRALQAELREIDPQGEFTFARIDRDKVGVELLREVGCSIVVDCSGPFQGSGTALVEAAIGAGCHYVDIADSRAFVNEIRKFDGAAKAASVAVLSGASSTPALTHAVLGSVTAGWRQIDTIDIAIVPGNRTPKGKAVIAGILSWVGQKVSVFREAQWQEGRGWTGMRWAKVEGIKPRRAYLADVPDLDLLPARFAPRVRAGFEAGMELGLLNGLIGMAGRAVRWKIVKSATAFTSIGTWIALRLDRFGTTEGGMVIEVAGLDNRLETKMVRWSLKASNGDGPSVPVIPAAAAVEALTSGRAIFAGARPAAGMVSLEEIKPWMEGLALEIKISAFKKEIPLFGRVMGQKFLDLPLTTRLIHRGRPAVVVDGEAAVAGAINPLGKLVAKLFGLPREASRIPVRVVIESRDGREHWTRFFNGVPMRSIMEKAGDGIIEERFGAVAIRMTLVARPDGLDMIRHSGRWGFLPLPGFLLPRIKAEERVDEAGRHRFDVEISAPVVGRLVAYRGYLVV